MMDDDEQVFVVQLVAMPVDQYFGTNFDDLMYPMWDCGAIQAVATVIAVDGGVPTGEVVDYSYGWVVYVSWVVAVSVLVYLFPLSAGAYYDLVIVPIHFGIGLQERTIRGFAIDQKEVVLGQPQLLLVVGYLVVLLLELQLLF